MSRPPVFLSPYADLDNGVLASVEGSAITLPTATLGDSWVFSLRFLARAGDLVREKQVNVRSLTCSAGRIFAVPAEGTYTLRFDDDGTPTSALSPTSGLGVIESALTVIGGDDYSLLELKRPSEGCWLLRFAEDDVPLQLASNSLSPESFVRIRSFVEGGLTWLEVRLMQAPLGATSSFERVLGTAPSIERARAGAQATDDAPASNELQNLILPLDFRGTFFLRWDGRVTRLLSNDSGLPEIADALNAMWTDGVARFDVTNVVSRKALIEFIGPLAGDARALITRTIESFEPGVCTFTLPLDRAACATALRTVPQITVPLEIEVQYIDDGVPEEDIDTAPLHTLTLTQQTITIRRELIFDELAVWPVTDYLHPAQPVDYIPFTPDQIIVGERHYTRAFGNAVLRTFSITHGLATDEIAAVEVRENASGGALLVRGVDYTIPDLVSDVELTVVIPMGKPVPALNALTIVITAAGPASVFQAHTHTIPQIVGATEDAPTLREELDALSGRIAAIETLTADPEQLVLRDTAAPQDIAIGDYAEIFPGTGTRLLLPGVTAEALALVHAPVLFPAIHTASVTSLTVLPLSDATAHAGEIFQNNTGATITIDGGMGLRSSLVVDGGYYGSDGRSWVAMTRRGTTKSYYPRGYERELFRLWVAREMWALGDTFSLEFDLALSMLKATTSMDFRAVVEVGAATQQTSPSVVGTNLEAVTWVETPLLSQRILAGGMGARIDFKHHFGATIHRSMSDVLSGNKLLYRSWSAADQLPAAASFAIRARLIDADTENSVVNATGYVSLAMTGALAQFS